jgi:peptide/nickel transport system permease protein
MVALNGEFSGARPPGLRQAQRRGGRRWSLDIWIPAAFLTVIVLGCFAWPEIANVPSPVDGSILSASLPMWSSGHIFGTDPVGNDVFSRILYGGRVSIEVGLAVNAIGLGVGGVTGILAAYAGGIVESAISRILDVLIAFPSLVLALVTAAYLGPGMLNVIWALSFFAVPAYARLARAQTLQLQEQDFILAARLSGTRPPRIVTAHIAPYVASRLITFCYVGISISIMFEASLSFLGLGVRPPAPSWGDMIAQGQEYLISDPSLVVIPSAFLLATVISINVLGDGIRARLAGR